MNTDPSPLLVHRPAVYALCARILRDPVRAEDLTQDTLEVALEKEAIWQDIEHFGGWIRGIARNLCRNALRKSDEVLTEDGWLVVEDDAESVLTTLIRQEGDRFVAASTDRYLNPVEQQVVHLRYAEDWPLEQIEAELALPVSARAALVRCRRKLRNGLTPRRDDLLGWS